MYNRSQTNECENLDCGRAIPFLGIYVSNFRYWFFAVCRVPVSDFVAYSVPMKHLLFYLVIYSIVKLYDLYTLVFSRL
jgi:hypothetical protein